MTSKLENLTNKMNFSDDMKSMYSAMDEMNGMKIGISNYRKQKAFRAQVTKELDAIIQEETRVRSLRQSMLVESATDFVLAQLNDDKNVWVITFYADWCPHSEASDVDWQLRPQPIPYELPTTYGARLANSIGSSTLHVYKDMATIATSLRPRRQRRASAWPRWLSGRGSRADASGSRHRRDRKSVV